VRRELGGKAGSSFLNRLEFGPPGAPDGDAACVHGDRGPVSAVYWETHASFIANFDGLRKTGGKSGAERIENGKGKIENGSTERS